MKIGTKTLLFGCHQFLIHPWYVYRAWKKIYKVRPDFWETVCIVIHDWGYWGCSDIDGPEGEEHPSRIVHMIYWITLDKYINHIFNVNKYAVDDKIVPLCLYHSHTMADKMERGVSKLYWADKLGTVSMPPRLWVWFGKLTGEMGEYTTNPKYQREECGTDPYKHFRHFQDVVRCNLEVEFGEDFLK